MTEPKEDPTTVGHEQHAGDPTDDGWSVSVDPTPGGENPDGGYTPREGVHHKDGSYTPAEHPHGEPDPGPSLTEDPGARGPDAGPVVPQPESVPPEIAARSDVEPLGSES